MEVVVRWDLERNWKEESGKVNELYFHKYVRYVFLGSQSKGDDYQSETFSFHSPVSRASQ